MVNFKKSTKGITLVALIITVIVLLVLAMASIKIAINGGIINRADKENQEFIIRGEKEEMALAYQDFLQKKEWDDNAELKIEGAEVTAGERNEKQGWNVTFLATNHKYFLYSDGKIEEIDVGGRASNTGGATPGEGDTTGGSTSGGGTSGGTTTPSENTTTEEPVVEEPDEGDIPWVDNGNGTFTRKNVTVAIGDYVAYDHTKDANGNAVAVQSYISYSAENASSDKNNGRSNGDDSNFTFSVNDYTAGWRVFGVNNGNLQLISAKSVGTIHFVGKQGFQYGPAELNAISTIYGQGKGAISARSINVDDVNAITGYDPASPGDGIPYWQGRIYECGNAVTYSWAGNDHPYYAGSNGITGRLSDSHKTFTYWDGNRWRTYKQSTSATNTDTGRVRITTITCTAYKYYPDTLTSAFSSENKPGIDRSSKEYDTLFRLDYWLASQYAETMTDNIRFGLRYVGVNSSYGSVSYEWTYFAYDSNGGNSNGVRPIVTITSNARVSSTGGTSSNPRSLTVK